MGELSARQAEIYHFIFDYRKERDMSPTFREIAAGIGLSLSTVVAHIKALRDKRYLDWRYNAPRSIHIIRPVD
jgi:repressor LexA